MKTETMSKTASRSLPIERFCRKCGKILPIEQFTTQNGVNRYSFCQECRRAQWKKQMRKRRRYEYADLRLLLIDAMGGECAHCGYSLSPSAIEVYSLGPHADRLPILLNRFCYSPTPSLWSRVLDKLHKSTLLCLNCRKTLHSGEWKTTSLKAFTEIIPQPSDE